jgi:hypothetical protein
MKKESSESDVVHIDKNPELIELVKKARRIGHSIVLMRRNKEMAYLFLVKRGRERKNTKNDPFLKNIGIMAGTEGPGDVSDNIHKYIAEAHFREFHPDDEEK